MTCRGTVVACPRCSKKLRVPAAAETSLAKKGAAPTRSDSTPADSLSAAGERSQVKRGDAAADNTQIAKKRAGRADAEATWSVPLEDDTPNEATWSVPLEDGKSSAGSKSGEGTWSVPVGDSTSAGPSAEAASSRGTHFAVGAPTASRRDRPAWALSRPQDSRLRRHGGGVPGSGPWPRAVGGPQDHAAGFCVQRAAANSVSCARPALPRPSNTITSPPSTRSGKNAACRPWPWSSWMGNRSTSASDARATWRGRGAGHGRQIAQGLEAANKRGLIHRDIKPANIWLEAEKQRSRFRFRPGPCRR